MRQTALTAVFIIFAFGCGPKVVSSPPTSSNSPGQCLATSTCKDSLKWDHNSESDIAGYKIHYGLVSKYDPSFSTIHHGLYDHQIDVSNVTRFTVENLGPGVLYFAVTAYNTSSLESPYSNEVVADMGTEMLNLNNTSSTLMINISEQH